MRILSERYPGIIVICESCGALLAIDPHKDLNEENKVRCPLCQYFNDSGVREANWRYAIERREEAQLNAEENSDSNDNTNTTNVSVP